MNPKDVRQHTTEIEINATPDQVFRAVSEAEEIKRWFAPEAKVDPRVGGTYTISWGPGMEGSPSTITIYEPGHRFAMVQERTKPYGKEGEPPLETDTVQTMMVDYQIEAPGGGKTLLRLVHSGFGRGTGWDNEFEATRTGWAVFMQILKHGLERHPGVDSVTMYIMVPCALPDEEAWRRLASVENSHCRVRTSSGLEIHGEVRVVDPPGTLIGVAEEWNAALVGLYCGFQRKYVNLTVVLYGPARERAAEIEAAWKAGLAESLA
jgi:uncharacterized protein YndB with AHSA1/START domain